MATRLFSIPVGGTVEQVVQAVGSATVTDPIELTVDLSTAIVTEGVGGTRAIKCEEVILALENMAQYILKQNWPPA